MAYTRPYERRHTPTGCYKCHQYGHQEARCQSPQVVCGRSAPPTVCDARPVKGHTRRPIGRVQGIWSCSAGSTPWNVMIRPLRVLQANLGKRPGVQHSLMNDEALQHHGLLMITEPACFTRDDGRVIAPPSRHLSWEQILPTKIAVGTRFLIRSVVYASAERQARSVPVALPDISAIQFQLDGRLSLAISVYLPPADARVLQITARLIREAVRRHGIGRELIVTGDFNRHDQLWGGDEIGATPRQGEAQEILDLMDDLDLHLLLPRRFIACLQQRVQVNMTEQACVEALSGLRAYYKVRVPRF